MELPASMLLIILYNMFLTHSFRKFGKLRFGLTSYRLTTTTNIPKLIRVPDLANILKIKSEAILKTIGIKEKKRYFCVYDDIWYQFHAVNEVIVPFHIAYRLLCTSTKKRFTKINLLNTRPTIKGMSQKLLDYPVVAILGHFNHGKTTLLDTLGGTTLVKDEAHGITQV